MKEAPFFIPSLFIPHPSSFIPYFATPCTLAMTSSAMLRGA